MGSESWDEREIFLDLVDELGKNDHGHVLSHWVFCRCSRMIDDWLVKKAVFGDC